MEKELTELSKVFGWLRRTAQEFAGAVKKAAEQSKPGGIYSVATMRKDGRGIRFNAAEDEEYGYRQLAAAGKNTELYRGSSPSVGYRPSDKRENDLAGGASDTELVIEAGKAFGVGSAVNEKAALLPLSRVSREASFAELRAGAGDSLIQPLNVYLRQEKSGYSDDAGEEVRRYYTERFGEASKTGAAGAADSLDGYPAVEAGYRAAEAGYRSFGSAAADHDIKRIGEALAQQLHERIAAGFPMYVR